jgi:hypothetical protein
MRRYKRLVICMMMPVLLAACHEQSRVSRSVPLDSTNRPSIAQPQQQGAAIGAESDQDAPGDLPKRGAAEPESRELLIWMASGTDAAALCAKHGLVIKHRLLSDPAMIVAEASSIASARQSKAALSKAPEVRAVYFNTPSPNIRHSPGL